MTPDSSRNDDSGRAREVTVPLRTYKAVTVFSTLVAIVSVVLGFAVLDAALSGTGPLLALLDAVGLPTGGEAFALVGALAGLALIGFGATTYIFGTRFRTEGMGKAQEDSDEPRGNE